MRRGSISLPNSGEAHDVGLLGFAQELSTDGSRARYFPLLAGQPARGQATHALPMSTADRPVSTVMYAEDLVRRVRNNDPMAFEELYERYSPRVFGYLFQRLNGNAEEAEDLTADVFTRVYEKIDAFQPQGAPLSAWVFRIAHNRLIDTIRRRPRATQVTLDDAPELTAAPMFGDVEQHVAMEQIKAGRP